MNERKTREQGGKTLEPFDLIDIKTGETIPFPKERERKKDKDGNYRGAPYIYIKPEQWKTIEVMAGMFATDEEIAAAIQVSTRTLTDSYHGDFFQAIKEKGQSNGKLNLRRAQYKNAVDNGNTTMQIFLGKQWLKQRDEYEVKTPDPVINVNVSAATPNDIEEE